MSETIPHYNASLEIEVLGPTSSFQDVSAWWPVKNASGWVMYPDRVEIFDPETPPKERILAAEVAQGNPCHLSLHVRFDGSVWRGWRYRSSPAGGQLTHYRESEPPAYMAVEGSGVQVPRTRLKYDRFWRRVPAAGAGENTVRVWQPYVTCFAGFAGGQQGEME